MTYSLRRRRRRRWLERPRVRWTALALLVAVIATLLGSVAVSHWPQSRDRAAARAALSNSLARLSEGNATAARSQAWRATQADPDWGLAHALLGRALLDLGDGVAAEAELRRAVSTGFAAERTHHLLAEARLLQDDPTGALAEARRTLPRYRIYALRVASRAQAQLRDYDAARRAIETAVAAAPRDADAWVDLARYRLAAGDQAGAIAASAQAVALAPGNTDALYLRAQMVREQYGLVASLPWYRAALARDPWRHDILIDYAATLGDTGQPAAMLAAVRKAEQVRPGSPHAYYLQAVLAARAGDMDLAHAILARTGGVIDDVPGVLLLGATIDMAQGGYAQAIEKLRELIAKQPTNLTARRMLAAALLRTDASRDALAWLAPYVARGDADSYALELAARGHERIGERDQAAALLDRAALPVRATANAFSADDSLAVLDAQANETGAGNPDIVIPLIRGLIAAGRIDAAIDRAHQVASDNRGAVGAQQLLGDVYMVAGRMPDAVAAYRAAADIRFDEPNMLRLVEALSRAGRTAEAARALDLYLAQNPVSIAALRMAGHAAIVAGDAERAIDRLERAREQIGDGDAALLAELAIAYDQADELAIALRYAAAAYRLAPGNAGVADAYGRALQRAGRTEAARQLFAKAAALAPVPRPAAS